MFYLHLLLLSVFINVNCDYMCLSEKLNHAFYSYDESHKSNVADLSDSWLSRSSPIPSPIPNKRLIKPTSFFCPPESTIVNSGG